MSHSANPSVSKGIYTLFAPLNDGFATGASHG